MKGRKVFLSLQLSDSGVFPCAVLTAQDGLEQIHQNLEPIGIDGLYEAVVSVNPKKTYDIEYKVFQDDLLQIPHPLYRKSKDRLLAEPLPWHEMTVHARKLCSCLACIEAAQF